MRRGAFCASIKSSFLRSRRNPLRRIRRPTATPRIATIVQLGVHLAGIIVSTPRGAASGDNDSNERNAMRIYFVAKTVGSEPRKATQGVVERKHWVTLKKELAADGFVITYWNSVSENVWNDTAA